MAGKIHYEVSQGVAVITLDNPEVRNAYDYQMTTLLHDTWTRVKRDPEVRCVIVTGTGDKAFCTGWDIRSTAAGESQKFAMNKRTDAPYSRITAIQNRCFTPVITAVNGQCVGGGLHFVADSDITLAAESATFFDNHVQNGLVAALEPVGLARRIPLDRVFRMVYLGGAERITAEEALRIGLVGEVTPGAQLMSRARELAAIVAAASPAALSRSKRAIWESLDCGLEEGLDRAHRQLEIHADHPDQVEGPTAFFEKRKPNWAPFSGDDE